MRLRGTKLSSIAQSGGLGNQLWDLASSRPSLDLQFADTKSLVDATTGQNLVTFSRASGGTYVNSQGVIKTALDNEPRFDHNPSTGESLGLLVEEQRSNLLLYSEEADNPAWNIISSSIIVDPNVVTAPNGVQAADKVKEATTTGAHTIEFTGFAFQAGTTYTVSFYAKAAERSRLRVTWPAVFTNRLAFVDISPETYSVINDGGTITQVFPAGNNWFRITSTTTCTTTTTSARVGITLVNTGTNVNYTGDGTSGIYIWGAQLEAGAFPTSYIKTEDATATRAADIAQITGTNFSSWYRQDEGTVFCGFLRSALIGSSNFANLWALSDNTASERFLAYNTGDSQTIDTVVTDGGVSQGTLITPGAITANSTQNHAFVYKVDDFAAVRNAGSVITDTSGSLPAVDRIYIGANHSGGEQFSGAIRRLAYWGQRLSNNVLQSITQ